MVSGSNHPPRNHAPLIATSGASTVAASAASSWGASAPGPAHSTKPPSVARTASGLPRVARKLRACHDQTASTGASVSLVKRYSSAATGRLAWSASLGSNGLQPVTATATGSAGSRNVNVPNGKRAAKLASRQRGRPKVVALAPLPVPLWPNSFQPGTGPSSTRATGRSPLTHSAAKVIGSWKTSGRWRNETCESAPVPSRQSIPAPIPPSGKATRLSRSPV